LTTKFMPLLNSIIAQLSDFGYTVETKGVDAVDYGLAQNRRRCFLFGHRSRHRVREPPKSADRPTVRNVMAALGPPNGLNRHEVRGAATAYDKHQPSEMDQPAKTVRAGHNGPGGGGNSVRLADGSIRYFTIRELARLQGLPDCHEFDPVWSHAMMEIGNACPPAMASPWLRNLTELSLENANSLIAEGRSLADIYTERQPQCAPAEPPLTDEYEAVYEEADVLRGELKRREHLVNVLSAQAAVLKGCYWEAIRKSCPDTISDVASRLRSADAALMSDLGQADRDALAAAINSSASAVRHLGGASAQPGQAPAKRTYQADSSRRDDNPQGKDERPRTHKSNEAAARQACKHALAYAELQSELAREQRVLEALRGAANGLHSDTTEHICACDDEANGLFDEAPFDQELPPGPKLFISIPKHLLEPADEDAQDFYDRASVAMLNVDENRNYHSTRATLVLEDADGSTGNVSSIVDSGAAWCAIKYSTLTSRFPLLAKQIEPSSMKFRNASGGRMSLIGRVSIPVWIGARRLLTSSYVFEELSADFLLGTNAIRRNGCVLDFNSNKLYVKGDHDSSVTMLTDGKEEAEISTVLTFDSDKQELEFSSADGTTESVKCATAEHSDDIKLVTVRDHYIGPRERCLLDPRLLAPCGDWRSVIDVEPCSELLAEFGLTTNDGARHYPRNGNVPFMVANTTDEHVTLPKGTCIARGVPSDEDKCVRVMAVLEDTEPTTVRGIDEGGIDDLKALGFSLDDAIDPDKRREDGSYEPLSDEKKKVLYKIAARWKEVWSTDTRAPRISYLVVLDIPTGDAKPVSQAPYPIPAKLRSAAMDEINKLLKAGLIEPSMSDWASPTLVRVKKDSTPDNIKVKLAIDYRRVNAVTQTDAGGLGTQSDILYGVGGVNKFIGLVDAAGGFYQYCLCPSAKHRSAFILPTSMGGTLFQFRVAPYGLQRNPSGYSRGMQWVLKGLHERNDLNGGKGGALSWLDDICMRATSFEAFCDIFDLVLERLCMAGMTLKGSKCDLLKEHTDLLGFVATPHGLMLQKPKLSKLIEDGIPVNPKEARTFLGATAFLRRMVPRMSLLAAPMIEACKLAEQRKRATRKVPSGQQRAVESKAAFLRDEQELVDQSWQAIMDHLDSDAVVSTPDFDDPLAEFVICTDASDIAVGGVLMQWQHPTGKGPGPAADEPVDKKADPINNSWRFDKGWELKIIGYYSKTLDTAQRNYPAFDRESGAILVCVRHWSDLITYHPTTVYTDSSVATSMLSKHNAPPRLQRWGAELGTYLPHLKIAYRRGTDNGLADLLSRFPAFQRFTGVREVENLPDDYFDRVGEAPLFTSPPKERGRDYLKRARYELYDPKKPTEVHENFWCTQDAPEIPGRGFKDRLPRTTSDGDPLDDGSDEGETDLALVTARSGNSYPQSYALTPAHERFISAFAAAAKQDCTDRESGLAKWLRYVLIFRATLGYAPLVLVTPSGSPHDQELASHLLAEVKHVGCEPATANDDPELTVYVGGAPPGTTHNHCWVHLSRALNGSRAFANFRGYSLSVQASFDLYLPIVEPARGFRAPPLRLHLALAQAVAHVMYVRFGTPVVRRPSEPLEHMLDHWAAEGYGKALARHSDEASDSLTVVERWKSSQFILALEPEDTCEGRTAAREFDWQDSRAGDDAGDPTPSCDPALHPTDTITLEMQTRDPQLAPLIAALRGDRRIAKATQDRVADKYELRDDGLHRIILKDGETGRALVVPRAARGATLARYHYSTADGGGHDAGGQRLYDQVRRDYYWPDMERECHAFVAACWHCGGTRSQPTIQVPSGTAPTPGCAFEVIHVDHKGQLPMSNGCTHVLVVVCRLTRFTLFIPVRDATAETTLNALISHVFSIFGVPLVIVSDNGGAFANKLMTAAEQLYGYRQIFVLPHTPQANGLAEAAVKKLKLVFDRHTEEYRDWYPLCAAAQMSVNQRITSGHGEMPFVALFGHAPTTLSALEQPSLLPGRTPEQKEVRQVAVTISRLHRRLQLASDEVMRLAALADDSKAPTRSVAPGDKVWLVYSDAERSRYIRKHGHGRPWRHAFTVKEVKPHAVMLEVPTDGTVPEVLPWQSLRKCSFAAPHFHDDDLPRPELNEYGSPLVPASDNVERPPHSDCEDEHMGEPVATPNIDDDPTGWKAWEADPNTKFQIERIVKAERVGRGWTLHVKWVGYPGTTSEPLSYISKIRNLDPEILADIERCKEEYIASNPSAGKETVERPPLRPAPTRIQPDRVRGPPRSATTGFVRSVDAVAGTCGSVVGCLRSLREKVRSRIADLLMMQDDPTPPGHATE
ncbi:MAG: hypothetical protein CBB72_004845, partial [Muricauda sp. TMED12]